jgi:ferredoxin like protein
MKVDAKLAQNLFKIDKEPHISIDQQICATLCTNRACIAVCPADLYEVGDRGDVVVNWEGCLECGACMICCAHGALSWRYPRGGFGVHYRLS